MATFRRILTFTFFLLLATACFAQSTPTGQVVLSTAPGACPQTNFTQFNNVSLDSNGNWSLPGQFVNFAVGSYCVKADYQGDASHNPSSVTVTLVVNSGLNNTVSSMVLTPNPMIAGQVTNLTGSVQNQ